jgi:hypothetical protein
MPNDNSLRRIKDKIPVVVPLIQPTIDWNNYVSHMYELTRRSPTSLLDKTNRSIGDYFSFITSLGTFSEESDNIITSTRLRDSYLGHLTFSFLVQLDTDDYLSILRDTELSCIDNLLTNDKQLLVIFSGSVLEWKISCKLFCSEDYNFKLRFIFDAIVLYFEINKLFNGLQKKFLSDESFILL